MHVIHTWNAPSTFWAPNLSYQDSILDSTKADLSQSEQPLQPFMIMEELVLSMTVPYDFETPNSYNTISMDQK